MLATFRSFKTYARQKLWDWNIQTRWPSDKHQLVNLLYQARHEKLFAQVSPHNIIPFQQVPFTLFKSFSTSSNLGSGSSSESSTNDTLFEKIDKAAYRLLYVKLEKNDIMHLSALWMQAKEGPCIEPQPTDGKDSQDLVYWQKWKDLGNMSKEEAAQKYLKIAKKYD